MFGKIMKSAVVVASCGLAPVAAAAEAPLSFGSDYALSTQGSGGGLFATLFGTNSAIISPKNTGSVIVTWVDPSQGVAGRGSDGDISLSYTLGNPVSGVGVEMGLDITSISTNDFGDSGSFSLTFSRLIAVGNNSATFIGLSGSGLGGWGEDANNERGSIMVTQLRALPTGGGRTVPFIWTLGYGTEVKYNDTNPFRPKEDGFYWGMGVGMTDWLSGSVSGTENQVNVGFGLRIPGVDGLEMSVGQYDVFDNNDRTQTAVSVKYSYQFGG
jgi:hypothetical protein